MVYQRILITGSRTWTNTDSIRQALIEVWHPNTVLITGACPHGVDLLAEQCWTSWGGTVERWPADWTAACTSSCPPRHRRDGSTYCPQAGMNRNCAMVTTGRAELCIAFMKRCHLNPPQDVNRQNRRSAQSPPECHS